MPLSKLKRGNVYFVKGRNAAGLKIPRHSTECTTLSALDKYLQTIREITVWRGGPKKQRQQQPAEPVRPVEMTLAAALEQYKMDRVPTTKGTTREFYVRELERQFAFFATGLKDKVTKLAISVTNVNQLESNHLMQLQNYWLTEAECRGKEEPGIRVVTALGYRRISRGFIRYCVREGWLEKDLWGSVNKPPTPKRPVTMPLDGIDPDDKSGNHPHWDLIRASIIPFLRGEILTKDGTPFVNPTNPLCQHPENFLAFLELMYHTGLRRSDAIKFDPRKLKPSQEGNYKYTTLQIKGTNTAIDKEAPVTVFPEPWLAAKLKALPVLGSSGLPFFQAGLCKSDTNYVNVYVARVLSALGEAIGVEDLRCHRFRDSFAVNFLNGEGGTLEGLRVLLGHKSIKTTETYYNPWCGSREKHVEKQLNRARRSQEPAAPKLTVVPAA